MAWTSSTCIACRFGPNSYLPPHCMGTAALAHSPLASVGFGLVLILSLALLSSRPATASQAAPWVQYGVASWYGIPFHGRTTANGERYDMFNISAAHPHAPLGIHAIVTHLQTGRMIRVRINDRGPFMKGRVLDLSYEAARRLGMVETGLALVKIEFLPETQPRVTFMVQVGAYEHLHNARHVQQTLKPHYANSRIIPQRQASQILYRVRIGPFSERSTAEQASHHLQSLDYQALILPQSSPRAAPRSSDSPIHENTSFYSTTRPPTRQTQLP